MKGSGGSIGAYALKEISQQVEKFSKNALQKAYADTVQNAKLVENMETVLREVMESIQVFTGIRKPSTSAHHRSSLLETNIHSAIQNLSKAIMEANPTNIKAYLTEIKEYFIDLMEDLERLLNAYEFDEAATVLKKLEKDLRIQL